ncbi:hypothetical protein DRP07_11535 [Archaeoglobales archaeon]|nr:MAG: hypothetical protein DRP07_11535 [Archaeoglobales archaeon]
MIKLEEKLREKTELLKKRYPNHTVIAGVLLHSCVDSDGTLWTRSNIQKVYKSLLKKLEDGKLIPITVNHDFSRIVGRIIYTEMIDDQLIIYGIINPDYTEEVKKYRGLSFTYTERYEDADSI